MADNSLYKILDAPVPQGKTPIGYTVKSYQGVLAALQSEKYKEVTRNIPAPNNGNNYATRYFTILGSTSIPNGTNVDGFLFESDKVTPMYQAVCSIKDFMSFPVDCEQAIGYVEVDKGDSLSNGRSQKSGITYPPKNLDSETITSMKEDCTDLYIGVGISTSQLAYKFFETFFQDLHLSQTKIQQFISKGYLNAQILIPQKGTNARALHAKVILNAPQLSSGTFDVWIPNPILLLNDFSEIGSITVSRGKGQEKVGDSVKFPLASSRYYHKTGVISGFTSSFLEKYAQQDNAEKVSYVRSSLCSRGKETIGRVRLYFEEEAATQLGSLPQEYKKELFTGKVNPKSLIQSETISTSSFSTATVAGKIGVLVDVGHARQGDSGATGNGHTEYEMNKMITKCLCQVLTQNGIGNELVHQPLGSSVRYAKSKASAYACAISIHMNSAGASASGPVVLYKNNDEARSIGDDSKGHPASKPLGQAIGQRIKSVFQSTRDPAVHQPPSDGIRKRNDGYLRGIGDTMPAVLIEAGFISNKNDVEKLMNPQFLRRYCKAIVDGVVFWYNNLQR